MPEIQAVCIEQYTLSAYYCRKQALKGGVCICIKNYLTPSSSNLVNLDNYFIEKDTEVCAIQMNIFNKFFILTIYRSCIGNFSNFMTRLEQILQTYCNYTLDLIICGDLNINSLEESSRLKKLNTLLKTYNLLNTVTFPTRIGITASTAIDIFF
jgi:exonuclease III